MLFPCPFCGLRDETEFHYVGEPKARPEPAGEVGDAAWTDYLYFNANPKGEAREVWLHLTCMEMFVMTRDTRTNAVIGADPSSGRASGAPSSGASRHLPPKGEGSSAQ
jgi:sarcosine oxidase subunit delta